MKQHNHDNNNNSNNNDDGEGGIGGLALLLYPQVPLPQPGGQTGTAFVAGVGRGAVWLQRGLSALRTD